MNTANLQLEGLYLAVAAINNALVLKGVLTRAEVDDALRVAEDTVRAPPTKSELSLPNREAIAFPLRLLRLANKRANDEGTLGFAELARSIGEMKDEGAG